MAMKGLTETPRCNYKRISGNQSRFKGKKFTFNCILTEIIKNEVQEDIKEVII